MNKEKNNTNKAQFVEEKLVKNQKRSVQGQILIFDRGNMINNKR